MLKAKKPRIKRYVLLILSSYLLIWLILSPWIMEPRLKANASEVLLKQLAECEAELVRFGHLERQYITKVKASIRLKDSALQWLENQNQTDRFMAQARARGFIMPAEPHWKLFFSVRANQRLCFAIFDSYLHTDKGVMVYELYYMWTPFGWQCIGTGSSTYTSSMMVTLVSDFIAANPTQIEL